MPLSNAPLTNFGTQVVTPATGAVVLYPRAVVSAKFIYNDGSEVNPTLLPSRVTVTFRPHHQCGTCEAEFNATAIPFDLRRLNGIFLSVFMAAVPTIDTDVQQQKYLQFVGYADSESVKRSPDGTHVVISARDLSSLLRDLKPMYVSYTESGATVGAAGGVAASTATALNPFMATALSALSTSPSQIDPTPLYSDSITSAINRILAWAGYDKGQFEIDDQSGRGNDVLSSLTDDRGTHGPIPIKHRDVSAWEAIEHAAALANVLVSVDLGKIVLRNPADAFALPTDPRTPPKYSFSFGRDLAGYVNALEVDVTKKFLHNRKGVRLVAVEAGGRNVISADYPPDAAVPPKHAPKLGGTKAKKARQLSLQVGGGVTNGSSLPDRPREVIAVGGDGVHSVEGLQKLAERYYRERSRQELEGTLVTHVWDDKLFALRNGNRIEIRVRPDMEAELTSRPDEASQVRFLKENFLVNETAAHVMLSQIRAQESTLFYLRSIAHEWSTDGARTTIDFVSIVEI